MSENLSTQHWAYLYGQALASGKIKVHPEDFQVNEVLGFEPSGEGEHSALLIQKKNLNTAFVAEQLAKYAGVPLRDVAYAGRKDKYALTSQWFTVYHGKRKRPKWQDFQLQGLKLLTLTQHSRKIKLGSHKGNRFTIVVRDFVCNDPSQLNSRLKQLSNEGIGNYYGQQRFGEMFKNGQLHLNGNLMLASRMLQGERISNRNKRNLVISAMRSWLFNEVLSERINAGLMNTILPGDALILRGSNSFFIAEEAQSTDNLHRLREGDLCLSGPLWGRGKLQSDALAAQFERNIVAEHISLTHYLEELQLRQERRALKTFPHDLQYTLEQNSLTLSFGLDKGVFATSVLREFLQKEEQNNENLT